MTGFKAAGFLQHLEKLGEDTVRTELAEGKYGSPLPPTDWRAQAALDFLERKSNFRQLTIAEEALSIAKDANRIASEQAASARESAALAGSQAKWAMYAAIIATVAALITAKDQLLVLIFGA
mgnify:FL=1